MGRVEREAVFETNSSSTHSLSIKGGDYTPDNTLQGKDVKIVAGEFGWGPERHTDTQTKASYLLTWVMNYSPGDSQEEYLAYLREALMLQVRTVSLEGVEPPNASGDTGWGYIGHQSDNVAMAAFESEETLLDFLFNPASVLIIDNDNH